MALVALLIALWLGLIAWRRRQQDVRGWKALAWGAGVGGVLACVLLLIDLEGQKMAAGQSGLPRPGWRGLAWGAPGSAALLGGSNRHSMAPKTAAQECGAPRDRNCPLA